MKVTIDGILNTAIDMKKQKNIEEKSFKNNKQTIRTDSVEIKNRLASRLNNIQIELKNLQSSLTKDQIIKEGIGQLKEDINNGGANSNFLLKQIRFEKEPILSDFIGDSINNDVLNESNNRIDDLITKDIGDLKKLQIEIENIIASNIVDSDIKDIILGIESSLQNIDITSLNNISDLSPDMVIDLIK